MPTGLALVCAFAAGGFSRPVLNYLVGYPGTQWYLHHSQEFVPTLSLSVVLTAAAIYVVVLFIGRQLYRGHPAWKHWLFLLLLAYYATGAESLRTIASGKPTDLWLPFPRLAPSFIGIVGIPCFLLSLRSPLDGFFCSGMAALYAAHLRVMHNVGLDLLYFVTVPVSVVYLFLTGRGPIRAIASFLPLLIIIIVAWGMESRSISRWDPGAMLSFSVYVVAPLLGSGIFLIVRHFRHPGDEIDHGSAKPPG